MAEPSSIPEQTLDQMAALANRSLGLWPLPQGSTARLINISENLTYLVEAPAGWKSVLRVHRPGYHDQTAIQCELAWSQALKADGQVLTPAPLPGKDGALIQDGQLDDMVQPRHMVMFEFVDGVPPKEDHDLAEPFTLLGRMAARSHLHSMAWRWPQPFQRPTWDLDSIFGPRPTWGDWRQAPNVTPDIRALLERVEALLRQRLAAFGKGEDRYGLIHADMRLANLLLEGGNTWLIDFDDCGMGWHLYDFAAAVSFMEDHPQVPALKRAWLGGYRAVRPLPAADAAELDSFVMLRRMALLAWIGSHMEATEPQTLAPHFATGTAALGEDYLSRFT